MKRPIFILSILILILGTGPAASALTITDTVDWNNSGIVGRTANVLLGWPGLYIFSYTHDVIFSPPTQTIDSATLTLSHLGNFFNQTEVWLIFAVGGPTFLGFLSNSAGRWVDQSFVLPPSLYDKISGASWSISFALLEPTNGLDLLGIDKSVLSVEYTPVSRTNNHIAFRLWIDRTRRLWKKEVL